MHVSNTHIAYYIGYTRVCVEWAYFSESGFTPKYCVDSIDSFKIV